MGDDLQFDRPVDPLIDHLTRPGVYTWFWPRASIPSDVTAGRPAPATWGLPIGFWANSSCNVDKYIKPQALIFDTTLCVCGAVF